MKNLKSAKLLVMILSVALLIGAIAAVATSAAEDDTYAIKSINISHDDSIMVLLAVDALDVDPATIEVKYTIGNGEAKKATYYKNVDIYKDGNSYPVFYTEGIPMKDMGEEVKAEAHKVGTSPASPAYKDTSVATYLYTKLYKEGYVSATEGEDLGRKTLYLNLLSYGAQAQKVLWNNKHPEAIRTLVTDVIPVFATDATIGGKSGLIKLDKAGYLDLKYTGSDLLVGWKVTSESGVKTYYNNVYVAEGAKISPITTKATTTLTFDEAYTEESVNLTTSGSANKLTFTESGVTVTNTGKTNTGVNGKIGVATVKTDADGNKYLNLVSPGRGGADTDRGHGLQTQVAEALTEDANVVIFSFDVRGTAAASAIELVLRPDSAKYAQFNNVCALAFKSTTEWTNYRLEYYHEQGVVQLYINGVYEKDLAAGSGAIANIGATPYANINGYNGSAFDIDIDNVAIYKTTKEYSAFPYTPKQEAAAIDFEDATLGVLGSNPSNLAYDFGNGVSAKYGGGNVPECIAELTAIKEGDNTYVRMAGGPRVASSGKDRGWVLTLNNNNVLVPDVYVNTTVLELDIKLESKPILPDGTTGATTMNNSSGLWDFTFTTSKGYVRFDPTCTAAGEFKFAGNVFAIAHEWYTVRFEFCHDTGVINVYSKPLGSSDWTRSYTVAASAATIDGKMENILGAPVIKAAFCGANSGQSYGICVDNVAMYSTILSR